MKAKITINPTDERAVTLTRISINTLVTAEAQHANTYNGQID